MAKLIPRRLPVQLYRIVGLVYKTNGGHCANCGRVITWLATVAGEGSTGTHVVGMDCAATLASADDFEIWNAKMKAVQKVIRALAKYQTDAGVHNHRSTGLQNRGGFQLTNVLTYALPRLVLDAERNEVVVMIPRYYHAGQNPAFDDTGFTRFRATRPEWESHWGSVEAKLRALGVDVAAPFLPAEAPEGSTVECPRCHGSGEVDDQICSRCDGSGTLDATGAKAEACENCGVLDYLDRNGLCRDCAFDVNEAPTDEDA